MSSVLPVDVGGNQGYDPGNLITSLTINNLLSRDVGVVLEAIIQAGFDVEINLSRTTTRG